jgi:hypothetical protein
MKQFEEKPVWMESDVNQQEFRVVGMSRSGNHAIINWIFHQIKGRVCFLNCVEGKTNPFHSARPLCEEQVYEANYPEFVLAQEQAGNFSHKQALIYSYEDSFLGNVFHPSFEAAHNQFVGSSRQRFDLLILRDPFNLFASRLHSGIHGKSISADIRIWKQHAREFLGMRSHLIHNPQVISYNAWYSDIEYRRHLAEQLGLSFTDHGINLVPEVGYGSSFDGHRYNGNARRMKVLERWMHCEQDPTYRKIFEDKTLVSLSRQIFGHLPGTERIYQPARSRPALQATAAPHPVLQSGAHLS